MAPMSSSECRRVTTSAWWWCVWTFCWARSSRCCRRPAPLPSATPSSAANPASGPGKGRPEEPRQPGPPRSHSVCPDPSPLPEWGARSTREPPHAYTVTWAWPIQSVGSLWLPGTLADQPARPVSVGHCLPCSGLGLSTRVRVCPAPPGWTQSVHAGPVWLCQAECHLMGWAPRCG